MHGWTGNLLRVDLDTLACETERLDPGLLRAFLGGRGLAAHLLSPHIGLSCHDPRMPVILAAGPLTATLAPTSGMLCVSSRSPLTGGVGDAMLGGGLGTALRRAGFDAVCITGRAPHPVGLRIENSQARVEDASFFSGKGTDEVLSALRGRGSVACTGPAAEAGSLLAGILADVGPMAGRGGLGLSWAFKNLRYVTAKGSSRMPVADPSGLKAAREAIVRLTHASPVLLGMQGFGRYGTGALYDLVNDRLMLPTDNFSATHFPALPLPNAHAFRQRYEPRSRGCKGCHILCRKVARDGRRLPEFEAMAHFTALIGNADVELAMRANALCLRYGLDPVSTASTLACRREISGEPLTPERIEAFLGLMASGQGLGREMNLGSQRLAAAAGQPELSMSVKGLELPAYDPRGACGMALGYAVSTRGGCHLRALALGHEILRKPVATDRFSFSGKARIIKIAEDQGAAADSLTACRFTFLAAGLEEYARAVAAATGQDWSAGDLLAVGERIAYLERMMNARAGFTSLHDDLPQRFFSESATPGPGLDTPPLRRDGFLEARARYYRVRGLDEQGLPVRSKAEKLGLTWKP